MLINTMNDIIHDTSEWLKFAELKNGMIVTLNSVIMFVALVDAELWFFSVVALIFLTIATLISLLSFRAAIGGKELLLESSIESLKADGPPNIDKILHYKEIAKFSGTLDGIGINDYHTVMSGFAESTERNKALEKRMCQQAVDIAFIAYRKHYIFNMSLGVEIVGFVLLSISMMICA